MSTLYERIEALCVQRGITGYRLCKDIGVSPNLMTELRTGRRDGISSRSASLIAQYFGVSSDYILYDESEAKPDDAKQELLNLFDRMSPADRAALLASAKALEAARRDQGSHPESE